MSQAPEEVEPAPELADPELGPVLRTAVSRSPAAARAGKTLAGFIVVLGLILLSPAGDLVRDAQATASSWRAEADRLGALAPLVYVLVAAALMCAGFPKTPLGITAGLLFDWPGLIWLVIAATIGSCGTFRIVRWGGREWFAGRWPRIDALASRITRHGALAVAAVRQAPMPLVALNTAFALSDVRERDFLLGTMIGNLPQGTITVLFGAGIVRWDGSTHWFVIGGVIFGLIWVMGVFLSARLARGG